MKRVHRLRGRLDELGLRVVAEADRRRASERTEASSTRAWLRRELQMPPREAKQHMVLAAALTSR